MLRVKDSACPRPADTRTGKMRDIIAENAQMKPTAPAAIGPMHVEAETQSLVQCASYIHGKANNDAFAFDP
jgi:hypothetical protein